LQTAGIEQRLRVVAEVAEDLRSFFDRLAAQVGLVKNVKQGICVAFGVLLETDRNVKEVLGIKMRCPCV
jgi:hypothetical protein